MEECCILSIGCCGVCWGDGWKLSSFIRGDLVVWSSRFWGLEGGWAVVDEGEDVGGLVGGGDGCENGLSGSADDTLFNWDCLEKNAENDAGVESAFWTGVKLAGDGRGVCAFDSGIEREFWDISFCGTEIFEGNAFVWKRENISGLFDAGELSSIFCSVCVRTDCGFWEEADAEEYDWVFFVCSGVIEEANEVESDLRLLDVERAGLAPSIEAIDVVRKGAWIVLESPVWEFDDNVEL